MEERPMSFVLLREGHQLVELQMFLSLSFGWWRLSSKMSHPCCVCIRGLLEKYPTFGREKETGLLGALDT